MTAMAEEARLELNALRSVLEGKKTTTSDGWSDSRLDLPPHAAERSEATSTLPKPARERPQAHDTSLLNTLQDTRLELAFMQQAQTTALRDVESVRAKIFEALQTLAVARADGEFQDHHVGDLTNDDITSWAASMAAKLNAEKDRPAD
jgi:hypothetical protein